MIRNWVIGGFSGGDRGLVTPANKAILQMGTWSVKTLWVAAIAAPAVIEKPVPRGELIARIAGVALFAWGTWMVAFSGLG